MDMVEPLVLIYGSGKVLVKERAKRGGCISKAVPASWYFHLLLTKL